MISKFDLFDTYKDLDRLLEHHIKSCLYERTDFKVESKIPGVIGDLIVKNKKKNFRKQSNKKESILTRMSKILHDYYQFRNINFEVSGKFKEDLEAFFSYVSDEEFENITSVMEDCIYKASKKHDEQQNQRMTEILKLADLVQEMDGKALVYEKYPSSYVFFDKSIKDLEIGIKRQTSNIGLFYTLKPKYYGSEFYYSDESLIKSVEEMIKNNEVLYTKETDKIIKNFNEIKAAYSRLKMLDSIINKIPNIVSHLKEFNEIDFTEAITFLNNYNEKCKKERQSIKKYLSKFDLKKIEKDRGSRHKVEEPIKEKHEEKIEVDGNDFLSNEDESIIYDSSFDQVNLQDNVEDVSKKSGENNYDISSDSVDIDNSPATENELNDKSDKKVTEDDVVKKTEANTIYKLYIKYRAALNDKEHFLPFSEYAKQVFGVENLDENMVDEDLRRKL